MRVRELYINDVPRVVVERLVESDDLSALSPVDMERLQGMSHPKRRAEFISMRQFLARHGIRITGYLDNGAPVCQSGYLSISHCGEYGAFIHSEDHQVGIDIQLADPVIDRIAKRFVHPDDISPLPDRNRALWSIKEAVFKAMLTPEVEFRDQIRVERNRAEFNHPGGNYLLSLRSLEVNGLVIAYNISAPLPF